MSNVRHVTRSVVAAGSAVLLAVALGLPASARQPEAEKAVLQTIARINDAFLKRDAQAYEALTTTDFIRVGGDGRLFGRAVWMKTVIAAPGPDRRPGTFDETSVRVYGDAALVTVRNKPTAADGRPGPVGMITRVFEKQGSQWKLAFAQSTDLKTPAPSTTPAPPALPAWSASTPLEKEALAAFDAIQKANRDRDVAAWERLSASDHVMIGPTGATTTRAERVAALKAPPAAGAVPAPPTTDLRLMVKGGSLAVVSWKAGVTRSVKVLAKRGTGWQQVLNQASPIVSPS